MKTHCTVLHLIYRFDIGGLESVMVNLINALPDSQFNHVIVTLTTANPNMVATLRAKNIPVIELNKTSGNDIKIHYRLWRLFIKHKPDIVHSYNLATLEYQFIAFLSGVKKRIHAEHGRDIYDLDGSNKKYQILRRLINPFIHSWIPVSKELATWLINTVKIPSSKVQLIYNGIDLSHYQPATKQHDKFVVGTVGRCAAVKNQLLLIKAIELLINQNPEIRQKLQLIIAGNGELFSTLETYIKEHKLEDCIQLLGTRNDVVELLKEFDVFVLPSLAEGIALTLLEAMASGLAIIATKVGGNPELIENGVTGTLVPSQDQQILADTILSYMTNKLLCEQYGRSARAKVEMYFSLQSMVKKYLLNYQQKTNN